MITRTVLPVLCFLLLFLLPSVADESLDALRKEIGRLEKARLHLLETEGGSRLLLDNAAWQRTANLLAWGASGGEIREISGSCIHRREDYQQASHLFVSLVNWGLARDAALYLTSAVCKSRIDGDDFPGILELLIRGRRLLISPHNLSNRMIDELHRVRNPYHRL